MGREDQLGDQGDRGQGRASGKAVGEEGKKIEAKIKVEEGKKHCRDVLQDVLKIMVYKNGD